MRKFQLLRKAILSICMLLASLVWAQAQNGTIKGMVRDDRGPLAVASVTIEGKNIGTTTNDNGEYELKVAPGSYTLVVSYAGHQTYTKRVQVKANEVTTSEFSMMAATSTQGEDVVIVGTRSAGRSKLSTPVPV